MSHQRLDQLSDGIFAIVMTILVFEIHFPGLTAIPTNREVWFALGSIVNPLLSYVLSFTLLFTYWRAHHFFVSIYAKNVDLTLININVLFFMLISLIPFSASLLGTYSNLEISVVIFGSHIILIGLTLYWMRRYVLFSEHIKNPEITRHEILGSTVRTLVPVVFAVIAIGLAFVNVKFSIAFFTLAVLFNLSSTSTRLFERVFGLV
jgi:uncharacterized membrane protein